MPLVYIEAMTKDDLKKWRGRNNYSQAKLAKDLGVAVMTVSRWETGNRTIPVYLKLALNWIEYEGRHLWHYALLRGGQKHNMGNIQRDIRAACLREPFAMRRGIGAGWSNWNPERC